MLNGGAARRSVGWWGGWPPFLPPLRRYLDSLTAPESKPSDHIPTIES